ncbi:MAG TPA: gamma subclass chorismate mutase AroQ [Methylibium sp.]
MRQLIDQRLLLAQDVARAKWNTQGAIEDLPRETQIIRGLGQQAKALGLPAPWVESFFRAQIEASKTVQRELFARWERERQGRFDDAADLATVIRPKLDVLTAKLMRALADDQAVLKDPARRADVAHALRPLQAAALSGAAADQALAPLVSD